MKQLLVLVAVGTLCLGAACKKKDEGGNQGAEPTPTKPKAGDTAAKAEPKADPPAADDAKVKRGAYIAKLAGCQFCHTPFGPQGPDMAKTWAGGLEVPDVIGTWRTPNITQDKDTGIGGWTDEQIKVAVRQGKRPDGVQMFPIMPYLLYNKMSNDDADALVAFLRTIKPISNKVERATDLKIPPIPAPEPKGAPAPDTSDTVKHGEYLATMMHCVHCHTPIDKKTGGFDMSKAYAGGFPIELPQMGEGVLYSSNLTPHETGIKDYTDEQLIDAFRKMKKRDGSVIMGPMALYQGSWFDLPDDDAKAIVAFLRSLPPIDNKIPASTFKPKGPPPGAK